MAHWAELDKNNLVLRVTVGNNNDIDEGYQWIIDNLGGRWVKTSYNTHLGVHTLGGTPLRKNYAGIGYYYNEELDAFIPPKPEGMNSWILNEDKGIWEPPIPYPLVQIEDRLIFNSIYVWDESSLLWIEQPTSIIEEEI